MTEQELMLWCDELFILDGLTCDQGGYLYAIYIDGNYERINF